MHEIASEDTPRFANGFLAALNADDYELIRPHLRTVELAQEVVLVEVDDVLKRAYECYATVRAQYERLLRPGSLP